METELAEYLRQRIDGATDVRVTGLSRIPGGASRETWMFDASWIVDGAEHQGAFVLRKDPPASLVESERSLEYAFYDALWGSDVPVPRMRWLETDPRHLGSEFFIMERVLDSDANTTRIQEREYDEARPVLARRFYEILAAIHRFDWRGTAIERVIDAPTVETAWRRELDYWEDMIDRHELTPQPIARAAIRWLRDNPPPPARRVSIVHGDYRVGNFLYRPTGEITAIVDWEMAHLGDPLEDLAWSFMEAWEWTRDGRKGGIIEMDEAIAVYEEASGAKVDRDALHWWDVFSGVKAQGIWVTGAHAYQSGETSELILAMTSYWLTNFQDEILLRSMGRWRA